MRQIAISGAGARDFGLATGMEWIVANGLGGWASGTVSGANTRRYHGLLLAACGVAKRYLLVGQVQEEISSGQQVWSLGATHYAGAVHPHGYRHLLRFTLYPYPTWVYAAGDWLLEKSVTALHGHNVTVIRYRLITGAEMELRLRPFVAGRDYHSTQHQGEVCFSLEPRGVWQCIQPSASTPRIWLAASGAFQPTGVWYRSIVYPEEAKRGLDYEEDLFVPGEFITQLKLGAQAWFVAAAVAQGEGGAVPDAPDSMVAQAFPATVRRQQQLLKQAGSPAGVVGNLVLAADAFIIRRGGSTSVIAGYPWFTDWGRDAMIALPGLLLVTGRWPEALSVLQTFAGAEEAGLIPNRFPDQATTPEYNTADAPLWFIHACYQYARYTGDLPGLLVLRPTIKSIITCYRRGTRFGIGVDRRGLVRVGEPGYQLTWMDAKVGDWVVTPREGYPVEISALWYSALRCAADLGRSHDPAFSTDCESCAEETAQSFYRAFWLPEQCYLADVIGDDGRPDESLRPNQLFSASLPYPLLRGQPARQVVQRVWEQLYTPMGLRSLAPTDEQYHPTYGGDQRSRDSAYHRGTVWSWLVGPFITAYRQAYGRTPHTQEVAKALVTPLLDHLGAAGLGQVSEVFDADAPHNPGGCFAQAWSVAELLRLWAEEFDRGRLVESQF